MSPVNIMEQKRLSCNLEDVCGSFKSLWLDHTSWMGEEHGRRTNLQGLCLMRLFVLGANNMNFISRPTWTQRPFDISPHFPEIHTSHMLWGDIICGAPRKANTQGPWFKRRNKGAVKVLKNKAISFLPVFLLPCRDVFHLLSGVILSKENLKFLIISMNLPFILYCAMPAIKANIRAFNPYAELLKWHSSDFLAHFYMRILFSPE